MTPPRNILRRRPLPEPGLFDLKNDHFFRAAVVVSRIDFVENDFKVWEREIERASLQPMVRRRFYWEFRGETVPEKSLIPQVPF